MTLYNEILNEHSEIYENLDSIFIISFAILKISYWIEHSLGLDYEKSVTQEKILEHKVGGLFIPFY